MGLRGSQNLSKYLTPRAKQSLQFGRESGKELPSWNAVALYINHVELWKKIRPGETVVIFEVGVSCECWVGINFLIRRMQQYNQAVWKR